MSEFGPVEIGLIVGAGFSIALVLFAGPKMRMRPGREITVAPGPSARIDRLLVFDPQFGSPIEVPPVGLYGRVPGPRHESSETIVVGSFEYTAPFWSCSVQPDRGPGMFSQGYISVHEIALIESLWLEAVLADAVPLVATKEAGDALAAEPIDVERLEHSWDEEGLEAYAKTASLKEQLPPGQAIAAGFREIIEARLAPTLKIEMSVNGKRCFTSTTPFIPSTTGPVPVGPGEVVDFRVSRAVQDIAPPAVPVSRLILKARITRSRPAG